MSKLIIEGERPLYGSVRIHGAKNSVLPILAAAVLCGGTSVIENCPDITDVRVSLDILKQLGCGVSFADNVAVIDSSGAASSFISEQLMRKMRSTVIFAGALIGRNKKATVSYPGGCNLGSRPIGLHLDAFRKLGVTVTEKHGYVYCAADKIVGADIFLDTPSVGATENIMLAATVSEGVTTVLNAACEPEIVDLQNFLNKTGAKISGGGTSTIKIEGVKSLNGAVHSVIPDRIVAASYLIAAAATGGNVTVMNTETEHIIPVISVLEDCGCHIEYKPNTVNIKSNGSIKAVGSLRTLPYPGFPTDAQSPMSALLSVADGTSIVTETLFDSRFDYTAELNRMGADIRIEGASAIIKGVRRLSGAKVTAPDLRGAAALVIAGLRADGITEIHGIHHLDRGYQGFETGLAGLGARIRRV